MGLGILLELDELILENVCIRVNFLCMYVNYLNCLPFEYVFYICISKTNYLLGLHE